MKLYLDDDSTNRALVGLLLQTGHDVQTPGEVGLSGESDPNHLLYSLRAGRVILTHNHRDFEDLHELVIGAGGHHPGVFVIRKDNDPRRDLTHRGVVHAIEKLLASSAPIADELNVLNHWR